jgi:hypothetical protein
MAVIRTIANATLALLVLALLIPCKTTGQQATYNLSDLASKGLLITENRTVSSITDKQAVRVSAAEGSGVAWLKNIEFSNGTIEVDLRGKDVKQGSFLGIAFHGVSRNDCDVIYFRPFNFLATDSLPGMHMVQYVHDTIFGWERLRNEHPGVYENKLRIPPNPNEWFHVKIEVKEKRINVYVNNETIPSFQVTSLKSITNGKLGLWVGNSSEGDFANLTVKKR